jgi:hypothetical protein
VQANRCTHRKTPSESNGHGSGFVRKKDMSPKPTEPNEDQEFDPEEIDSAANQTPAYAMPPELDERTRNLTEWDEPPPPSVNALPDDEESVAEKLVNEGIDEAERERRMAAADPNFEP